ncbi:hypothetical protein V6Z88_002947 [Aspergillus fumigatus]
MYYILYLASLCRRRRWPEPQYESYAGTGGYSCIVRVNNREYQTDSVCESETLARENAAMRAYLICRNFSINDGMYPAGHDHGGIVQGIPVAIVERAGAVGVVQIAMRGAGSVSTDRLWTQPGRSPLAAGHDNATLFG